MSWALGLRGEGYEPPHCHWFRVVAMLALQPDPGAQHWLALSQKPLQGPPLRATQHRSPLWGGIKQGSVLNQVTGGSYPIQLHSAAMQEVASMGGTLRGVPPWHWPPSPWSLLVLRSLVPTRTNGDVWIHSILASCCVRVRSLAFQLHPFPIHQPPLWKEEARYGRVGSHWLEEMHVKKSLFSYM